MADQAEASYITDPDDFCRPCEGTGRDVATEYVDGRYKSVSSPCWLCGGSGVRSVKLTEVPA